MTFEQFLDELAKTTADKPIMHLSPGPFAIKIGSLDAKAAKILQVLDKKLKPETPLRDAESILIAGALEEIVQKMESGDNGGGWYTDETRAYLYAWWWLVFWASQVTEDESKEESNE
jgi:hypothetical protein